MGSLIYAMLCVRLYICFTIGTSHRYQLNLGLEYWITIKNILKYLKRMKDFVLVFQSVEVVLRRHI